MLDHRRLILDRVHEMSDHGRVISDRVDAILLFVGAIQDHVDEMLDRTDVIRFISHRQLLCTD